MLADTNLELRDAFGIIKSVKSYGLNMPGVLAPVLLRLQISKEVELELALLDNVAANFRRLLSSPAKPQCAMVFKSVNPNRIGGRLCLISTIGTRFYFSDDFPALTQFTTRSILDVGAKLNTSPIISSVCDLATFLSNMETKVGSSPNTTY
ncbi:unnamed protein product [Cochlearia groenlandica]